MPSPVRSVPSDRKLYHQPSCIASIDNGNTSNRQQTYTCDACDAEAEHYQTEKDTIRLSTLASEGLLGRAHMRHLRAYSLTVTDFPQLPLVVKPWRHGIATSSTSYESREQADSQHCKGTTALSSVGVPVALHVGSPVRMPTKCET